MQDLREQSADHGADEEAADVLLNRGPDDAEQDRQAPGRPLRRGSFFCLHARTRCGARILVPLPLAQQCERHFLQPRRRQRPARHQALDRLLAPGLEYDRIDVRLAANRGRVAERLGDVLARSTRRSD